MTYPGNETVITLYSPLSLVNDSRLERITMREPRVRDRIDYARDRGNDMEKEVAMIARLCNLTEDDVMSLTAADYGQLEEVLNDFLLPPDKRTKAISKKA